jgi:hypothetical protein
MKNSLWSCDLFRCESATLKTHWVLVVMDKFTRRIIGFGVHNGVVDGEAVCQMLERAIRGQRLPKYLSSDHDPLYRFYQWQAHLRVLEVREIKTRSLRAAVASLRRTTDRHRSARVFGQDSILDHGRLRDKAIRLPTLL